MQLGAVRAQVHLLEHHGVLRGGGVLGGAQVEEESLELAELGGQLVEVGRDLVVLVELNDHLLGAHERVAHVDEQEVVAPQQLTRHVAVQRLVLQELVDELHDVDAHVGLEVAVFAGGAAAAAAAADAGDDVLGVLHDVLDARLVDDLQQVRHALTVALEVRQARVFFVVPRHLARCQLIGVGPVGQQQCACPDQRLVTLGHAVLEAHVRRLLAAARLGVRRAQLGVHRVHPGRRYEGDVGKLLQQTLVGHLRPLEEVDDERARLVERLLARPHRRLVGHLLREVDELLFRHDEVQPDQLHEL